MRPFTITPLVVVGPKSTITSIPGLVSDIRPNPVKARYGSTGAGTIGFVARPNTPKPIADKLIAELSAMSKDPEVIAKFQSAAKATPEANPLTGDDFKKQVLQEQKNWKTVADREKIVVQQ